MYSRDLSRSWADRVLDVHLYVKGSAQSFPRVRGALAGHPLRVLKFHCQFVAPPPRPPPSLTPPPSVSPHPSVSPPFAAPPPSICLPPSAAPPSVSPPPSSTVCLPSSTLRCKRQRQEYSPSPSPHSEDSDETRLPPSPPHVDSDETTLDLSPTPSQQRNDVTSVLNFLTRQHTLTLLLLCLLLALLPSTFPVWSWCIVVATLHLSCPLVHPHDFFLLFFHLFFSQPVFIKTTKFTKDSIFL